MSQIDWPTVIANGLVCGLLVTTYRLMDRYDVPGWILRRIGFYRDRR